MGGDFGPRCIVPSSLAFLSSHPDVRLILVGLPDLIEPHLAAISPKIRPRVEVFPAVETIGMDEPPAQALRQKPDASMRRALELVRDGQAGACVSAGNTGALMALSRHLLKMLPGIDRPAIITVLPTERGHCHLLDLGANVDCTANQLYQFALMGAVAAEVQGCQRPRVALLNVGTEAIKGNQCVKQAAGLLQRVDRINFIGYVEGNGLYRGEADVIVCDGFVGNILLKTSEGLADMIASRIEQRFHDRLLDKLIGWAALPVLRKLKQDISPAHYNGASFLGVNGIVVKSHGNACQEGFGSALRRAAIEMQENLPSKLSARLGDLLELDVTSSPDVPSNKRFNG